MPTVDVTAAPHIAVKPFLSIGAVANAVTFICAAESVEVTPEQDESTIETFCGAYTTYKPEQWTITASSFLSYGANGLWAALRPLVSTVQPFIFRPDNGVASVTNPQMAGNALLKAFPFFAGGPGEPTAVDVVLAVQGTPVWTTA